MERTERAVVEYQVLDDRRGRPRHRIEVPTDEAGLARIVEEGFLHIPEFVPPEEAARLGELVDELARVEREELGARRLRGNGQYIFDLHRKHPDFEPYVDQHDAVALGRALLGPQVRARIDARIAFEGDAEAGVPWHIHLPGVTDPLPPFWSHPHSVTTLLYLDDVGDAEGPLVVAPGTHRALNLRPDELGPTTPTAVLRPARGDAVVMHGNLWHRTEPARADARRRRLLFLGYTAAWVVNGARSNGQPAEGAWEGRAIEPDIASRLGDDVADELLGRFRW